MASFIGQYEADGASDSLQILNLATRDSLWRARAAHQGLSTCIKLLKSAVVVTMVTSYAAT